MKLLTLLLTLVLITGSTAYASKYKLDEKAIELAFDQSENITQQLGVIDFYSTMSNTASISDDSMDKQKVAAIVAFAEWVLGIGILIPIHRIILGCDGQELKVIALYCVTLGGCGLLPLIDGVMLLVDDTKSRYIENPKYLMWLN